MKRKQHCLRPTLLRVPKATISKHKTRQRDRIIKNVGTKIRRVFFIYGPNEPTDFFHGVVKFVTAANKYDVVYDDYDEEEMGEANFEIYKMKVKDQVVVKLANAQHARFWKDANDCNCAIRHCYTPGLRTHVNNSSQKKGEEHLQLIFRCKNRICGRHRQVLLHLMVISSGYQLFTSNAQYS